MVHGRRNRFFEGVSLCAAMLLLMTALPAREGSTDEAPLRGVDRVLFELAATERPDSEALLDALLVSGPRSYDELIEALARQDGGRHDRLDARLTSAIHKALPGVPGAVQEHFLSASTTGSRREVEVCLALRIIADLGSSADTAMVLRFLDDDAHGSFTPPSIRAASRSALTTLMARDARV